VQRQATIVQEAVQRHLLVTCVADRLGDGRLVEDPVGFGVAPGEEGVGYRCRPSLPELALLLGRRADHRAFEGEECGDPGKRGLGAVGIGFESLEEIATCVSPAADLDDVARAIQVVVDGVRIGDQIAGVAGQQAVYGRAVVAARVPKQHVLPRCDCDPEVPGAAALLGLHEDAGRVHAQVWRLHRVRSHRFDQRSHQLRELLVPRAQRRLRDRQPFAAVDPFQPIERLIVLPAPHHRVRQQGRPGYAIV